MREGYTIAKDKDGNPSLIADCRTPIHRQEMAMALLKAGVTHPPEGAHSVELISTDTGLVSKWIAICKPSQPSKIQPKKSNKNES